MEELNIEKYREYVTKRIASTKDMMDGYISTENLIKLYDLLDWLMHELFCIDSGQYDNDDDEYDEYDE